MNHLDHEAELIGIIGQFVQSGWDLIDAPSKAWLDDQASGTLKAELITAIQQADQECGSCGCEMDALYKRALVLLR